MRLRPLATLTAAFAFAALPAWAQDAAPPAPTPEKGDVAWMLVATALVLMMSIPGLALFYGGLVRAKNMLSVLTQVFLIVCVASLVWVSWGYSLAFTAGSPFVGSLDKMFLKGVTAASNAATFSTGVVLPEFLFIAFQMTFACITPGNGAAFQRRSAPGGSSAHTAGARVAAPYHLRLERCGSGIDAWQSADGAAWSRIGTATIAFPATTSVGLAVSSHDNTRTCSVRFTSVVIEPLATN